MASNETIRSIMSRRSIRAFKPDAVPGDILAEIVAAGQAAPYVEPDSRHFSVVTDKEVIGRLNKSAIAEGVKIGEFQRQMFSAPGFDGTYGAAAVIVLAGKEGSIQHEAVCAASVQNMLVAAQSLGLASCWAYFPIFAFHGGEAVAWRGELGMPGGYSPCASVLLGYSAGAPPEADGERYKNSVSYI